MLYADFEIILKAVEEQHRQKMNKMKTERKVKTTYKEKINTHVLSGWCVYSQFVYGDVPGPLKINWGKDSVEMFMEHTGDEVNRCTQRLHSYQWAYWCVKKRK